MPRISQQKAAQVRDRLLDAAAEVYSDKGLEAADMDLVAGTAGVATGTTYNYFKCPDRCAFRGFLRAGSCIGRGVFRWPLNCTLPRKNWSFRDICAARVGCIALPRAAGGANAGRTANKARENLRAFMSWAWEQDYLEKLPRFPQPKPQRDVAGRHYLTKADLNARYFATYELPRPRGWNKPFTVGQHWRAALVVFFNYGVDTGTVFKTAAFHEPGKLAGEIERRVHPQRRGGSGRDHYR